MDHADRAERMLADVTSLPNDTAMVYATAAVGHALLASVCAKPAVPSQPDDELAKVALTVTGIVDDEHLQEVIDAVNAHAYVEGVEVQQ